MNTECLSPAQRIAEKSYRDQQGAATDPGIKLRWESEEATAIKVGRNVWELFGADPHKAHGEYAYYAQVVLDHNGNNEEVAYRQTMDRTGN